MANSLIRKRNALYVSKYKAFKTSPFTITSKKDVETFFLICKVVKIEILLRFLIDAVLLSVALHKICQSTDFLSPAFSSISTALTR